jgi:hypothetical protein
LPLVVTPAASYEVKTFKVPQWARPHDVAEGRLPAAFDFLKLRSGQAAAALRLGCTSAV